MLDLILQLLPLGVGAIAPTVIALIILILSFRRGPPKAIAFLLGLAVYYVAIGALLLRLTGRISLDLEIPEHTKKVLDVVVGFLLLIFALKQFLGQQDMDAPPPKWLSKVGSMSALLMFLFGVIMGVVGVRTLLLYTAGVHRIVLADLGGPRTLLAMALLIGLVICWDLIPLVLYALMPRRAGDILGAVDAWLAAHAHQIVALLCTLVGVFLLWTGLTGLGIVG